MVGDGGGRFWVWASGREEGIGAGDDDEDGGAEVTGMLELEELGIDIDLDASNSDFISTSDNPFN